MMRSLSSKGLNATELQKKKLLSLYHEKVEALVKKLLILDGDSESNVSFEHFIWANSVFWSRALNIPLPHSFVFPQSQEDVEGCPSTNHTPEMDLKEIQDQVRGTASVGPGDTVWVEGLVPGIDFCNHDLKPVATWEVDGTGSVSTVPFSMYLLSVAKNPIPNKEISISYGNKGNEVMLFTNFTGEGAETLK